MEEFLSELDILFDMVDGTNDLDSFEKEFNILAHKYKDVEEINNIANIVAHNYNCHKYNKKEALIANLEQWTNYNK